MRSSETTPKSVRWIGPHEGPVFGDCYHLVAESVGLGDVDADLTVYACPRPLACTAQLSEFASAGETVQLLGVWCEGEGRTGKTAPGVERVFWHAWPTWWSRRLVSPHPNEASTPGPIWLHTADAALAEGVVAAFAAASRSVVWSPRDGLLVGSPSAILWDGSQLGGREADHLGETCRVSRTLGVPVLTLLDFPRPETVAAARAIGATTVIGKPFEYDSLLTAIDAAVNATPVVRPSIAIEPPDALPPVAKAA